MDTSSSYKVSPRRNTSSPNIESRPPATTLHGLVQPSPQSVPDPAFANTGFFPIHRSSPAPDQQQRPLPAPPLQRPLPSVLVSPPPAQTPSQLPPPSSSDAATMSAVAALQFDPVFGMGSRTSYSSWPVIEQNHGLLGHELSISYASDTSLSPSSASRSISASPPRHNIILTAQQRELKRQREQVRREAKIASRRQATNSSTPGSPPSHTHSAIPISSSANSVTGSPSFLQSPPPPAAMADLSASSATGGLPGIYATSSAPHHISLLSEPATSSASLGSPSYMATGSSYSPSMHDHQQQGVFSASYQGQGYMPEYTTASFPASTPPTLHSQYPRAAMHDQQNLMYHMQPPTSSSMMHHQQPSPHHVPLPHPQLHQGQPHHSQHRHSGHQASPPLPPHAHAHNGAPGHHPYEGIVGSAVGSPDPASSGVRVVQSRPKPQCWEHGCNGRQFSTFSNLLRHQREKSGQAAKAVCPNCGAEFTRTTARNGHLQHDKCKQRRSG